MLTAADVPEAAVIPNRVARRRARSAICSPPSRAGSSATWASRWRSSWPTIRYVAEDALGLIDVVYDPLPVCASVADALAPGAPRLFPGTESNNVAVIPMRIGDADARCPAPPSSCASASPSAADRRGARDARPRRRAPDPGGGELHLIGSTKCIHINRTILAPIFGIPLGALRLTEVDVGGGFGLRGELYPEDILVPLAAMKLGRPVRWIEAGARASWRPTTPERPSTRRRWASTADGRIVALRALIRADIGAYVRTAALVPSEFGAALFPGPYRVPNYACDLWSVVTNKTPVGTLRSPGRPECNFARERLMDMGAARLGLDAAEIRRRNLIRPEEMPYDCGTKSFGVTTVYDSGDFPALFDELLRRLDYDRARAEQRRATRGRACGAASGSPSTSRRRGSARSRRRTSRRARDGRFTVDTGASSMGPGLETVLAQILGDALGLPRPLRRPPRRHLHGGERCRHLRLARHGDGRQRRQQAAAKLMAEARTRAAGRGRCPRTMSAMPAACSRRRAGA